MKITLIMAAAENEMMHENNPFMPLSLPLLAASAPDHEYTVIDLLAGDTVPFDTPADLIGISARFTSIERAYKIADIFRDRNVPVVMGGPQVSARPFKAIKHADAVVVGEGEQLWPVLLDDFQQDNLKQFYVCSPGQFDAGDYTLHQINTYSDLKNFPVPLRHLIKQKYVFDTVFASRGCPIGCDFCAVSSLFGKPFRLRPVADVVAEIETLKRRYYYLIDDTVFGKPSTYDYYCELYDILTQKKKRKYWTGQANLDAAADKKGQEVIRKAQQAGLLYASVGIESINPVTLKKSGAIRKAGVKSAEDVVARMKDNIRFIQDLGIIVSGWFVLGYEDDTIDTYYRTCEFCEEMNILPAVFPVNALHGTPLYERMEKEGRIRDTRFSNIYHPEIRDDDIVKALHYIVKNGYSLKTNLKRIAFYLPRFKQDKIHNTIFLAILHGKFKSSVDATTE